MNSQTSKKIAIALGVASVASSVGNVAVKAGPALQTLNNLTNSAEFSVNNTYGQSFSVDGAVNAAFNPFQAATGLAAFQAVTATLTTGFVGSGAMVINLAPVATVAGAATIAAATSAMGIIMLSQSNLAAISLGAASTATQTIGASISSTLFGPSTVKASTSFTNQLINDLSAF